MRPQAAIAALAALVALPLLAGCLQGGSGRTEWAFQATQIAEANGLGRTGAGVRIALVDTGINVGHPSMDHLVNGDHADGELVAFRDFIGGAQGVTAAFDDDGHGTHVAGILSARGSTGLDRLGGIHLQGAVPGALLLSARVCSQDACSADALPAAINWAVAQGADIVSLSLGGEFGLRNALQEKALNDAVQAAVASGTVVIASAGNKGEDEGQTDVESPAVIAEVIAVGAVGEDLQPAGFSSRGDDEGHPCGPVPLPGGLPGGMGGRCPPHQKPELVAPGVGIVSAWAGKEYRSADGTSQATPFVTAVVAILLQGHPDLSTRAQVERVKQVLVDSARPLEGQERPHDEKAGYGLVQAAEALRLYG
jgi:subtilisin family serine protease